MTRWDDEERETGTIVRFDKGKGFGFIEPDQGGDDLYFHITEVMLAKINPCRVGMRLSYHRTSYRGKECAIKLEKLKSGR